MAPQLKQISRKHYSEEDIARCIEAIDSGMTVYAGCKQFGIPMSTIVYRRSGHWKQKCNPGPSPVLSKQEEQQIVNWLNGRKWMAGFMRRNPGFSIRTPEAVSLASGRVTEKDIRGWFQVVDNWLTANQMREILKDPTRVFNGDETSFYMHPKSKEVIARTGSRNVYEIEQAPGKQNITVVFTFGASGVVVNPHVILPGKRLRKEVAQSFPSQWGLGQSERGWMDTNNFREYIVKIFHPFLVGLGVQFPIILFVDGHTSHKALEIADVCLSLGIVLISLYPNTTHITQPADVAVFKPLKSQWKRSVEEWRFENQGCVLTMQHFGSVLEKTVKKGITSEAIQNGFRLCGLQPFDPNALDYTKCIGKASSKAAEPPGTVETSEATVSFPVSLPLNNREPERTTMQNYGAEHTVSISLDRVVQAYDLIGSQTVAKIEGDINQLTREERIIRYLYREFIRPYISFHEQSTFNETRISSDVQVDSNVTRTIESSDAHVLPSSSTMSIDINNCEVVYEEDIGTCYTKLPQVVELVQTVDDNQKKANKSTADYDECDMMSDEVVAKQQELDNVTQLNNFENGMASDDNKINNTPVQFDNVLQEVTNKDQALVKRRLSDVLRLPPTPRRCSKHRNYAKQFQPVLTAGERLEAIRKKEEEKEEKERHKKRRAMEREDAKLKREILKI
ncbi:uncharacterized protein LOC128739919 [Sabethes cyaneus]|uniref:uncharacterized protein LOC128739919 n=1 Tax=Sabethes cyaneus TaxID=53552 RepID=UPI00237DC8E7|nr:uncharacterized protein LOC128739919 [Sabethes cyaneus]